MAPKTAFIICGALAAQIIGGLGEVPVDPWGNSFIYLSPGIYNREYDLESYGADGEDGGEEADADIENWNLE